MNILLVEPDHVLSTSVKKLLKVHGHRVLATVDAQRAVVIADKQRPDVIILELLLAGRSGIEFLYELRSYPDWESIPVIIYSSVPPAEALVETNCFEQLSVTHYFYKPDTNLSDLAATIDGLALVAA